jgi:D-arabinose 1-dehydrogenase-like Zn-dependent alcohol dehydrogenase
MKSKMNARAISRTFLSAGEKTSSQQLLPKHNEPRTHRHMKAAIVPSPNSTWLIKDTNTPEPGENQVLIKIHASGMCYTDVHQTRGELPGDFPRTLGHEPVGEIVAIGPSVTTRKIGDRVGVP